jgi:hypothetical protein
MTLKIKNEEAHRQAQELAAAHGEEDDRRGSAKLSASDMKGLPK